ncbi:von Willebrand factor-like [Homarus americanus]|uniref:von Willebrand factor-like n=1 Tax=Homarus americanus TaxID=6706 RepID=A0A8J5JWI0_HOMAM|nr:von Willebrand factor-like [Homarus americanus]
MVTAQVLPMMSKMVLEGIVVLLPLVLSLANALDVGKHCYVFDDPHIVTFDEYRYDWHGACNYSIAQSDFSYNPEVGVFGDFERCWGCASCLRRTTFKNDRNTVITINTGAIFDLMVNGAPYVVPALGIHPVVSPDGVHPVLAWRNGKCVLLQGSSRIVVHHCKHRLDVWAHPSHAEHLDGLCGHYNFYVRDDFTDRSANIHPLEYWPQEFPVSWKTNDQSNPQCLLPRGVIKSCAGRLGNPCRADEREMERYRTMCKRRMMPLIGHQNKLLHYIETCAFDLCMMSGNGADDRMLEEWVIEVLEVLRLAIYILTTTGKTQDATRVRSTSVTTITPTLTVHPINTTFTEGLYTTLTFLETDVTYSETNTITSVRPLYPTSTTTTVDPYDSTYGIP